MYLRTDEEAEAANAMQMAARFSNELERNPRLWRWVIIALHNAAQGVMVLSLRHGNGLLALTDECLRQWMKAHEDGTPYPEERLDTYLNLYKKVKRIETGQTGGNQRFVAKGAEDRHIKRLNSLRNEFIHFTPKNWSLEVDGLPQICRDASKLISFLGWETHNVLWRSDQSKAEAMASHAQFINAMQRIEQCYANKS